MPNTEEFDFGARTVPVHEVSTKLGQSARSCSRKGKTLLAALRSQSERDRGERFFCRR